MTRFGRTDRTGPTVHGWRLQLVLANGVFAVLHSVIIIIICARSVAGDSGLRA